MKTILTSINMNLGSNKNSPSTRLLSFVVGNVFALLATFLLFQYAYAEGFTKGIIAKGTNVAAGKSAAVSDAELITAFAKDPLNQNLVNAGLALKSDEMSPVERARWITVIGKMGWRSTAALQTLTNEAVKTQELDRIMVLADALLRRKKLVDESVKLMLLLEAEPTSWKGVYTRLKNQVPWRAEYLPSADQISEPAIIEGRIRTLQRLQSDGDRLTRLELAPSIGALVRAGKLQEAVEIWRAHSGDTAGPIHDPNFRIAAGAGSNNDVVFPFEWQFMSGPGFSAYPSEDGLIGATVAIQWDGRGVPAFMTQLTSAKPGNYQLSFRVDGDAQKFATKIGVRFRCGDEIIRFRNVVRPNRQIVTAETISPVPCSYPWIDVVGQVQDRSAAVDLSFSRITLQRIGT